MWFEENELIYDMVKTLALASVKKEGSALAKMSLDGEDVQATDTLISEFFDDYMERHQCPNNLQAVVSMFSLNKQFHTNMELYKTICKQLTDALERGFIFEECFEDCFNMLIDTGLPNPYEAAAD